MRIPNPQNSVEQKAALLRLLRDGPRTRRELSEQSSHSLSLTRQLLTDLVRQGMVIEHSIITTDMRGRPSHMWALASNDCLTLGLDVGSSTSRVLVLDASGATRYHHLVTTPSSSSRQALLNFLVDLVQNARTALGEYADGLRGIGVAYSGMIDVKTGYAVAAPNINESDQLPIRDYLQDKLKLSVLVEDSSRVIALAELRYAHEPLHEANLEHALCVNVGTGIGMGVLINGQLYRGSASLAGEIGHIPLQPNGDVCRCGRRGCLETLASGRAIANKARQCLEQGTPSLLHELVNHIPAKVTAQLVMQAAQAGDALALDILREAGNWLGIAIAIVINLFAPQQVMLTGGVMRGNPLFFEMVQESAERYTLLPMAHPLPITLTNHREDLGALGAALLAMDEEFNTGYARRIS